MPRVYELSGDTTYDECEELLENIENGSTTRSSCVALIVRVNEYLKKPKIEHALSEVLETYSCNVLSDDIRIQNNVLNIKFAEAALLLQSAVALYGKKVDLFWDEVLEHLNRNLSYEQQNEANQASFEKLEENRMKYKRKVRAQLVDDQDCIPIRYSVEEGNMLLQGLSFDGFDRFMAPGTPQISADERDRYPSNYEDNWDERCKNEQRTIAENALQWGLSLPGSDSREHELTMHVHSNIMLDKVAPVVHNLHELNIHQEFDVLGDYGAMSSFDRINRELINEHINLPDRQVESDFVVQQVLLAKDADIDEIYGNWDQFAKDCKQFDEDASKLKSSRDSMSEDSAWFSDESFNSTSLTAGTLGSCSSSQESGVDLEIASIMDKRNLPSRKTTDSDMDSGIDSCSFTARCNRIHSTASMNSDSDLSRNGTPDNKSNPICEVQGRQRLKRCLVKPKRLIEEWDALFPEEDEVEVFEAPRRKRAKRVRLLPTVTASLKKFNHFFGKNYIISQGEATVVPLECRLDDDDDDSGNDCELLIDDAIAFSTPKLSLACPSSQLTSPLNAQDLDPSFTEIMGNEASTQLRHVLEWRKFITDIISKQTTSDFDVHEEETKIIDEIDEVGRKLKFQTLIRKKTAANASRSFAALLHLANSKNVGLSGIQPNVLANSTLEVELLTKVRHHEQLERFDTTRGTNKSCNQSADSAFRTPVKRSKQYSLKFTKTGSPNKDIKKLRVL